MYEEYGFWGLGVKTGVCSIACAGVGGPELWTFNGLLKGISIESPNSECAVLEGRLRDPQELHT